VLRSCLLFFKSGGPFRLVSHLVTVSSSVWPPFCPLFGPPLVPRLTGPRLRCRSGGDSRGDRTGTTERGTKGGPADNYFGKPDREGSGCPKRDHRGDRTKRGTKQGIKRGTNRGPEGNCFWKPGLVVSDCPKMKHREPLIEFVVGWTKSGQYPSRPASFTSYGP
jgi:hypothetical protein